ncbi:spore coat U domain-containing protein [Paraherbaspirillum soli]|uniref:Spore coat U domain-containing protein n=1 Tax=Paraherbaspirillum soli TaxID=631222 RepID=A0ABW0M7I3_9BURK
MRQRIKWLPACIVLLALPWSARAQLVTCTGAVTGIAFGSYASPGSANADGSGTINVTCTATLVVSPVNYTITLSTGNGSYATRKLVSGTHSLNYNLYTNTTRLNVWGDGSAGTSTVSDNYVVLLTPTVRPYTVYGRIPGSQNPHAGSYQDNLTVTITY